MANLGTNPRFPSHYRLRQTSRGLSLIELVLILLMIAILAVTALPKLLSRDSISVYTEQAQLISMLRSAQWQAMNNSDRCVRVSLNGNQYQLQHYPQRQSQRCAGELLYQSSPSRLEHSVALSIAPPMEVGTQTNFSLDFNAQGQVFVADDTVCPRLCLRILGENALPIMIESQGYIYAG